MLVAPPTLLYLTGGLAFGHVESDWLALTENQTKAGWTLGAGFEHMFGPNWTAKAEVLYIDLGATTVDCLVMSAAFRTRPGLVASA